MVIDVEGKGDEKDGFFIRSDVRETATTRVEQANFNIDDFLVAANTVNLKNKTSYLSISTYDFTSNSPDVDDVIKGSGDSEDYFHITAGTVNVGVGVKLPHGAVVTACVVYGDAGASGENWTLRRQQHQPGSNDDMASAAINTEDTSISNATVNNNLYTYSIVAEGLDAGDDIYGARITYTTDYD